MNFFSVAAISETWLNEDQNSMSQIKVMTYTLQAGLKRVAVVELPVYQVPLPLLNICHYNIIKVRLKTMYFILFTYWSICCLLCKVCKDTNDSKQTLCVTELWINMVVVVQDD